MTANSPGFYHPRADLRDLRRTGDRIEGTRQGDYVSRDLAGGIDGDSIRMTGNYTRRHGDALTFAFTGRLPGDAISGALDLGENPGATWTARRHEFGRG